MTLLPHFLHQKGRAALPILIQMANDTDDSTREDALWAISYICDSDADSEQIETSLRPGLLDALFANIDPHVARSRITPSLRAVGNLTTGISNQPMITMIYHIPATNKRAKKTAKATTQGLLPRLAQLAQVSSLPLRRELMWCISNILAGGSLQTRECIKCGIIDIILFVLGPDQPMSDAVRKEVLWCIINAYTAASDEDFTNLVFNGEFIVQFFNIFNANYNNATTNAAFNSFHRILEFAAHARSSELHGPGEDPITSLFSIRLGHTVEVLAQTNHPKAMEVQALLDRYNVDISLACTEY